MSARSARRITREVVFIALRHILLPINAIIFGVVVLLIIFGETREGLFLGAIVVVNIVLGFVQDVRAWLLLERLQFLTLPKITRIEQDGTERAVELEAIARGDRLALTLGDQAPCDGVVVSSASLEVNEGLITGESDSFPRAEGANILAGSVVTSGKGVIRAETSFADSRMAKMARGLARYSANPSPIQRSIETVIRYTVAVLLAVALFIAARGAVEHEAAIRVVEQIGALASVLVPQGLVVAVTLLFTYGAGHFYNRHVLLQEINATEKFGRIKNLCMDKTGTLTENELTAENLLTPPGADIGEMRELAALYARHSGDSSQTIRALERYLPSPPERDIADALPFSSWRHYGGIAVSRTEAGGARTVVLVGGPEIFLPHLCGGAEHSWLTTHSDKAAREGKRVLCVATATGSRVPRELAGTELSLAGLFVLGNKLREGVREAVDFFQNRGVAIRILSGDHPETVRVIASAAGVRHADALTTGAEMKSWDATDYAKNARRYALFARIEPEQKERLIEAFKENGFTAMIGDGANDALSVKKADLGIALYDGAPATRQIAAIVLMRNSFVELPAGVRLADRMIESVEIFASIFLNQTFLQFLLFFALALIGLDFPLTPLNVTFMNYFTVGAYGVLISLWAINPPERTTPASQRPFLARIISFPLALSLVQTLAAGALYVVGRAYLPGEALAPLLLITIVAAGFAFFALASEVYSGGLSRGRRLGVLAIGVAEAAILFAAFHTGIVLAFFGLTAPSREGILIAVGIAAAASAVMFGITEIYFKKKPPSR